MNLHEPCGWAPMLSSYKCGLGLPNLFPCIYEGQLKQTKELMQLET